MSTLLSRCAEKYDDDDSVEGDVQKDDRDLVEDDVQKGEYEFVEDDV
jgi:hypothetical protein